ncbi:Bug family tripartite tricarboxylate transporter substrate binding protein [Caenimonas soli]|uniref:Bug family tripartite tricarboxylate transporter substrate binding protein n=1 Tax=Caenimonas soli TaxID=2735555 RepID=UPI0015552CDC|nr:tripartite tricarboxylate transporter substrate binding protein [Caenimonas soli]NPC58320.1 tripartite tricarboxylate transporter substrate binding protein [Caenimonas soli]
MRFSSGRRTAILSIGAALASIGGLASAQAYPAKPIRILVGFAPGGSTDIVARLIAQELNTDLGRPVVVENKAGAGGRIAAEAVAAASPDGYTLLLGTAGTVVQIATGEKASFDLMKDLTPIALLAENPHVLVVHPSVPARTVQEFAALARSKGDMAYASAGEYTSLHVAGALFGSVANAKLLHVPYKSGAAALADLLSGRIPMMFNDLPTILSQVKSGGLRALAVTGPQRSQLLPDAPTMAEGGFGTVDTSSWFGLMAPAGAPATAVDLLNNRINAILQKEAVKARFTDLGLTPTGGTPAQYAAFLRGNLDFWKRAVALTGARLQ